MRSDDDVCSSPCPILRIHSSGPKVFFTTRPPRAALSTIAAAAAADYLPPYDTHTNTQYKYTHVFLTVPAARQDFCISFVTAKCMCMCVRVCVGTYIRRLLNVIGIFYFFFFSLTLCQNIKLDPHTRSEALIHFGKYILYYTRRTDAWWEACAASRSSTTHAYYNRTILPYASRTHLYILQTRFTSISSQTSRRVPYKIPCSILTHYPYFSRELILYGTRIGFVRTTFAKHALYLIFYTVLCDRKLTIVCIN